jgi:hypothetical protein
MNICARADRQLLLNVNEANRVFPELGITSHAALRDALARLEEGQGS